MISRRISRKPQNDDYRRLAQYIAGAGSQGGREKCLMAWCAGCWAGDDFDLAIQEVADTQDLNQRTTREKTYHLIISFRPEDEAKLTPEVLNAIEVEFAKALGFEDHQRHCGVHQNTANLHMHVAYNMIHPERLTRHEPFRDFHKRDRVCRELEQHFGLSIDNGREAAKPQDRPRLGDKAATVEAHTGQQSFQGYALGHREAILAAAGEAQDWQDLHKALAVLGMEIKPRGAGLVIKDRHGQHAIKASALDRSLSKARLEQRLGPYQEPSQAIARIRPRERYQARPLHRSPERDGLYAAYRDGISRRRLALDDLHEERRRRRKELARDWARRRREIESMALTRRDRWGLLRQARQFEAEARRRLAGRMNAKRRDVVKRTPYANWSGFLRWRAEQGDETALAVLRFRGEEVAPETSESTTSPKVSADAWGQIHQGGRARDRHIREDPQLQPTEKSALLAVSRMQRLAALEQARGRPGEPRLLQNVTYDIDARGIVLFTLGDGGRICDAGDQVFFNARNEQAAQAAKKYARAKWGQAAILKGCCFQHGFAKEPGRDSHQECLER